MPDIKGIIPLMYMIFAPRMTMRFTIDNEEKIRRYREHSAFAGEKV